MASPVLRIIQLAVALCCISITGSLTAHQCYFCEVLDKPVGSDCWNKTSETAQIVTCNQPCYTRKFQSGGGHDQDNYWSIKRGCTGLNDDEEACEESSNCDSPLFGACVHCCSDDLCNSAAGLRVGSLATAALLLALWLGHGFQTLSTYLYGR